MIMRKKSVIIVFFLVLIIFAFSLRSIAGCKSDCRDEYESEIESCNDQYDDPDEAGMLQMCLDDAKSEYESCIDNCENWGLNPTAIGKVPLDFQKQF